jgi:glycosyltransferase involved in cell wall biosynthesis
MASKVKVGWLMDNPGYMGGAELEAVALAQNVPEWAEIKPCPPSHVVYDCDVYVIHNCVSYNHRLIDIIHKSKVVKRIHDVWRDGDQVLRRWLRNYANLILLSSPLQRKEMVWEINTVIEYVPSYIDLSKYNTVNKAHRAGNVWLGRIHPSKGLQNASQWATENKTTIDVYGEGSTETLPPRLCYMGKVAHRAVASVLASYEKLVFLPDAVEPYGRVVVEAWAAGCELVVNRQIGALWWIENHPDDITQADKLFWEKVESIL